ncbi:MAG: nuclear transport factor 2 family protein [Chloracidobacterium sp.]|nr:nuclear transport factor 2 family protein [Chloracidobacterium sp.]
MYLWGSGPNGEGFSAVPHQVIDGGDSVVGLGTYSGKYLKTGKRYVQCRSPTCADAQGRQDR